MLDRAGRRRLFEIQGQGTKVNMNLLKRILVGISIAACAGGAWADEFNLRQGATAISHDVYGLHMFVLYICCAIGVVVFGAMGYSMYAHRKSVGAVPAQFHENTRVEILWTIVPLLILVGMAVPATATLIKMYDTGGEDLIVEVRGYQWKWQYKYLDENHKSDGPLILAMLLICLGAVLFVELGRGWVVLGVALARRRGRAVPLRAETGHISSYPPRRAAPRCRRRKILPEISLIEFFIKN